MSVSRPPKKEPPARYALASPTELNIPRTAEDVDGEVRRTVTLAPAPEQITDPQQRAAAMVARDVLRRMMAKAT